MATILEIEGQLVRTVERTVTREVPLEDMLEHLERRPPVMLPALPRNRTLGLYWDESNAPIKKFNIALAIPPAIRLIPIDPGYEVTDVEPRLAIPWTVFVFQMRSKVENPRGEDWAMDTVTFWFSKDEPKGDANDNLIPALLPNVYSNAAICWGDTGVTARQPLNDRIDQTVNEFYQTQFNHGGDIVNNWPFYKANYKKWAKETREKGAGSYRDWPDWTDERRTHKTLQQVLEFPVDITAPIVAPDGIPELRVNPTFGRVEEWLKGLNNNQRLRLSAALDMIREETPELLVAQQVETPIEDEDDD